MEIVDDEEPAAHEVLAQARGLLAVRVPLASTRLLENDPRVVEQRVVVERHGAAVVRDLNARHPRERGQEVRLRERIVDRPPRIAPAARARAAERVIREPAHVELGLGRVARGRVIRRPAALVELRARAADQTEHARQEHDRELADAHGRTVPPTAGRNYVRVDDSARPPNARGRAPLRALRALRLESGRRGRGRFGGES